jgi:hypothetical protein
MILSNQKQYIYESNEQATIGRLCRGVGQDTEQLVQALPARTTGNGRDPEDEGAATTRRDVSRRQVLH